MKKTSYMKISMFLPVLSFMAIIAGCSSGSDSLAVPQPANGSATIGASGGTVLSNDNVVLSVPAGAVGTSATFRIARQSDGAPELVGVSPITPIYEITPHGATFSTDALVTIPFDPTLVPQGKNPFLLRGEPGGGWHVLPDADSIPATSSADVDSLSWYAIGVCTPDSQGYSFGVGDCPGNHELKLEYLDGSGIPVPVQRDTLGRALPVFPDITAPTNVTVRVTWTRPAGVNRDDTVSMLRSAASTSGISPLTTPAIQTANQQVFTRDYVYAIDPALVVGASGPNGSIFRIRASASYSAQAFVVGLGPRIVGWSFDTDIAFRVRYSGPQPTITQHPSNRAVNEGQTATFSVVASGSGLTYQWQRSNDGGQSFADIGGATGASYTTAATVAGDNGAEFRGRVCAAAACVASGAALLTVSPSATFPIFLLQPASVAVLDGQTASLTAVASGTPAPGVQWYKFDGFLGNPVGTPCGSSGTSTVCNYTTPALALADSGSRYYAVAGNIAGSAQSNTATVTVTNVAMAPSITTQPSDVTVDPGNEATFTVTASGTAPLNYQWSRNGVNIRGANGSTCRARNAQPTDNGASFSVEVINSAGNVKSRDAILNVNAAPSSGIDNTFGTGGKVTTAIGAGADVAKSVAIQPDGRIVAAGYTSNGTDYDFALVRYNADGLLDATFGTGGKVTTAIGTGVALAYSVAIQPDGKIVAGGSSQIGGTNNQFALARYNANGSIDTTFGTGGKVTTIIGNYSQASSVAIQSDGKIVAAGSILNGTDYDFALVRYNVDGSLDATFGTGGIVTTAFGTNTEEAIGGIAIQPDGKIVAGGYTKVGGTNNQFAVARYTTNGSLDTTFGTGGKVTTPVGTSDIAFGVVTQSDGKIVTAGYSLNGANYDVALVRYTANGALDTSFGTGGIVTTAIGTGNYTDLASSVAIQSDGKIVAAGYANSSSGFDFALARYTAGGVLDTTFGTGGKVTIPIGTGNDLAYSVAIQSDGKIVMAGESNNGTDSDFALVRYMP